MEQLRLFLSFSLTDGSLAVALHTLNCEAEAFAAYERALAANLSFAPAWSFVELSLRALGRGDEARQAEARAGQAV